MGDPLPCPHDLWMTLGYVRPPVEMVVLFIHSLPTELNKLNTGNILDDRKSP